jgi:hypothetical protein
MNIGDDSCVPKALTMNSKKANATSIHAKLTAVQLLKKSSKIPALILLDLPDYAAR